MNPLHFFQVSLSTRIRDRARGSSFLAIENEAKLEFQRDKRIIIMHVIMGNDVLSRARTLICVDRDT